MRPFIIKNFNGIGCVTGNGENIFYHCLMLLWPGVLGAEGETQKCRNVSQANYICYSYQIFSSKMISRKHQWAIKQCLSLLARPIASEFMLGT